MDELRILVPLTDDAGGILHQQGPSDRAYPVLREPVADSAVGRIVDALKRKLTTGPAARALRMERQSRLATLSGADEPGRPDASVGSGSGSGTLPSLVGPAFLLLSSREGGFARVGFWLDTDGERTFVPSGYVEMVVDEASVEDNGIVSTFCHEMGHVIIRNLVPSFADRPSPSTKMHMSMTVTDYQTAFDEGFAEHFQTVVADQIESATPQRAGLVAQVRGLWHSGIDAHMRVHGVRENLYIHGKTTPTCMDECADAYELYLDSETSILFDHETLKTGQQMMACEGVIATLLYRMTNDKRLAGRSLDIDLKIIAAIGAMGRQAEPTVSMMEFVDRYMELFPEDRAAMADMVIATTYGATMSQDAVKTYERAARSGRLGNIDAFRADAQELIKRLRELTTAVTAAIAPSTESQPRLISLWGNIGPELWLLNSDFRIARAVWEKDRSIPLALNLNTATEAELMTVPGIDSGLAAAIVRLRGNLGYLQGLADLESVPGMIADVMTRLQSMMEKARQFSGYIRE